MNRSCFTAFLVVGWALVLGPGRAVPCPELPTGGSMAPLKIALSAESVVVEYFTASKNGDADHASSLIDYVEWAREMGLDEKAGERFARSHRDALAEGYLKDKAAGSTKAFTILKATVLDGQAVFEVTQAKAGGVLWWEVRVKRKEGRWAIVGFRTIKRRR